MQDTAGDGRRVLAYLREMVQYCREERRHDLAREYEDAVRLAAQSLYGKLPPRKEINFDLPLPHARLSFGKNVSRKTIEHHTMWALATFVDETPPVPLPAGVRVPTNDRPLRKITGRFYKRIKGRPVRWERFECGHEAMAPVGYETPKKSRRCFACGVERMQASKKKPGSVPRANAKAVSA